MKAENITNDGKTIALTLLGCRITIQNYSKKPYITNFGLIKDIFKDENTPNTVTG